MIKRLFSTAILMMMMFALIVPTQAFAATYYPGTTITVQAGDILYSSKGWQTAFVGHIAIVGNDGKVYHSTPAVSDGGAVDTLSNYFSRFSSGSSVKIYRFDPGWYGPYLQPIQAAQWAQDHINEVEDYDIWNGGDFTDISQNYCSKFVWQAFWYGANYEISDPWFGLADDPENAGIVAPNVIINGGSLSQVGTATAP